MFLKETEENIRRQFAVFTEKFERAGKEIEARIHAEPADIALLLKYLYANMPFSDVADYSYEMFREFAAHGAQLRKEQIMERRNPDSGRNFFGQCGIPPCQYRRNYFLQTFILRTVTGESCRKTDGSSDFGNELLVCRRSDLSGNG